MARRNNAAGARRPPRRSERRSRPIAEARPEASESLSDQPRAWRMIQSGRESEEKANATRLEGPGLWATLETGRCEKTKTPTPGTKARRLERAGLAYVFLFPARTKTIPPTRQIPPRIGGNGTVFWRSALTWSGPASMIFSRFV